MTKRLLASTVAFAAVLSFTLPASAAFAVDSPTSQQDTNAVVQAESKPNTARTRILEQLQQHSIDAKAAKKERVIVTLRNAHGDTSKAAAAARLREQNYRLSYWRDKYDLRVNRQVSYLVNAFSATLPASQIAKLRQEPAVASVEKENVYYPLENNARVMEGVTQEFEKLGFDGTGMVVSVIDSGIDINHKDFQDIDCQKAKIQKIQPGMTCKVPFGHNYADELASPFNNDPHSHGQHVAGIIAANGKDADSIKGVAPQAQILGMKVFPEDANKGASDIDIIAAIEDSVKLGADVINMSLGSTNGVYRPSETAAVALQKAREAGVLPVIAAGNEGQNFSKDGTLGNEIKAVDDGTVGSPAVYSSSFAVASVENSVLQDTAAEIRVGDAAAYDIPYLYSFGPKDFVTAHELVYVGTGVESDYTGEKAQLNGKFAFMERTDDLSYTERAEIAREHGAGGIVAFNRAKGKNHVFTLYDVEEDFTIPGYGIGRAAGQQILSELQAGKKVTFKPTERLITSPSDEAWQPSNFTSWGGAADLSFKPEIAGVGGFIRSLGINNSYVTMSGTSMASPNVAGLSALVLQQQRQAYPQLGKQEALARAEKVLVNTAKVLQNGGIPYSVRQIGGGLAQVDKAVASSVTATVEGDATLALKEIAGQRQITVTLQNDGKQDVTFSVPAQKVWTEEPQETGAPQVLRSASTVTADATSVTVPAGGTASVNFTLTPAGTQQRFIEGWLEFTSQDAGKQPDVRVPYYGFYGDWDAEQALATEDRPFMEPTSEISEPYTMLVGTFGQGENTVPLSVANLAISPNDDGEMDDVTPVAVQLRNLDELTADLVDVDGNVLRHESITESSRRSTISDLAEHPQWIYTWLDAITAKVWNAQTAEFEAVPDGDYKVRLTSKVRAEGTTQTLELPFKVDTVAPEVSIGEPYESAGKTYIDVQITDAGAGIMRVAQAGKPDLVGVEIYADGKELTQVKENGDTYTVMVPAGTGTVSVLAYDGGFNTTNVSKTLHDDFFLLNDEEKLTTGVLGDLYTYAYEGNIDLSGAFGADYTRITVNGEDASLTDDGKWYASAALQDGDNTVEIRGYNSSGEEILSKDLPIKYDMMVPEFKDLNWNPIPEYESGNFTPDQNGMVTITGKLVQEQSATDPHDKLQVRVFNNMMDEVLAQTDVVKPDGSFQLTFDANKLERPYGFVLFGDDGSNYVQKNPLVVMDDDEDTASTVDATWQFDSSVQCYQSGTLCFADPNSGAEFTDEQVTVHGRGTPGVTLQFTPRGELVDGDFTSPEPTIVKIGDDGNFTVTLPADPAGVKIRVTGQDKDGQELAPRVIALYADHTPPVAKFETPLLYGGKIFLKQAGAVRFKGTAQDDGLGYALTVNGDKLAQPFNIQSPTPSFNLRTFDYESKQLNNGDTVFITAVDQLMNNGKLARIPVVVDEKAPTIDIHGAKTRLLREPQKLTFTAKDDYITKAELRIDGQLVAGATNADLPEQRIENVLRTLDELAAEMDAAAAAENGDTEEPATAAPNRASRSGALGADAAAAHTRVARAATLAAEAAAEPAPASGATELTLDYDAAGLLAQSGIHSAVVTAYDAAGNTTTETVRLVVDAPPVITGPDATTVTVSEAQLASQSELAKLVLAQYGVTDADGSYTASGDKAEGDPKLELAEGTVLHAGANEVRLLATAANGDTVLRTVTVTIALEPAAQPGTAGGGQPGADNAGGGAGGAGGAATGEQGAKGAKGALATTGTPAGYSLAVALLLVALGVVGLSAATEKRRREA